MTWRPNVTVASVIERDGKFLMVEELDGGRRVFNQPAGHLEPGESLIQAVVRETLEETGRKFEPEALVGVYRWRHPDRELTFLRVTFCGAAPQCEADRALDEDILAAHWFSREALARQSPQLRSPLVLRCIDDYLAGKRYPLELLVDVA